MEKRHEALIPLSHHHHHALVIALKLKRAGTEESKLTLEEIKEETLAFWKEGGEAHFREEEEVLLPAFAKVAPVDTPDISQMLIDHVVIRAGMSQLEDMDQELIPLMRVLGERLTTHIRLEERHIFPMIEKALSETQKAQIAPSFHANAPKNKQ